MGQFEELIAAPEIILSRAEAQRRKEEIVGWVERQRNPTFTLRQSYANTQNAFLYVRYMITTYVINTSKGRRFI